MVPFNPNNATSATIHAVLAQVFSFTFLAGIFFTARKSDDAVFRKVSMALATMCMLLLLSFFALPKDSRLVLVFEAASGVFGQLWIIWVTFYSYNRAPLQ